MDLDRLASDIGAELSVFTPHAKYNLGMDFLEYVKADSSYTAEIVDQRLTIYWNPDRTAVVGIKLKGFRHDFLTLKDRLGIDESAFLPLVRVFEMLLEEGGLGENIIHQQEEQRLEKYRMAESCVRQITLTPDDIREVTQQA